jgi:2-polyprenyl-3-methyl-5-hydroxy-6-metoxy-1,4-benzoquinol methylase
MSGAAYDPKKGEREYFARIGEEGRRHALRKPFDDGNTLRHLAQFSALLSLMRPPPARIVEFGCGTGWLSLMFAASGYEVIGIDISPDAIQLAREEQQRRGLAHASFRVADYETVQINEPTDYVIFYDSLHHAENEEDALRAAHRTLGPNGIVMCFEPGAGHGSTDLARQIVAEFGVHEKDMPPETIIRVGRRVGFRRHLVLPLPEEYLRQLYRPGYIKGRSPRDLRGRELLSLWRLIRWFFRARKLGLVLLFKD